MNPPIAPAERSSRFRLQPFAELRPGADPAYLIKDVIPRSGLIVIWGPPKCGKSFIVFDMSMHVALGREYHHRRVQQGAVVYFALEGGRGFNARIEAYRQRHCVTEAEFFLITDRTDLIADHKELITAIRKQAVQPALVVIDTLNRSLNGSENRDEDMSKYIRAADAICDAYGCAVAVVHHCGVEGTRPRGHTSLTGAADAQLAVKRDDDIVVAEVEWMKDGLEGAKIISRLETVQVGTDTEGDPITSCIIVPVAETDIPNHKPRRLIARQQQALKVLIDLVRELGKPPPSALQLPGDDISAVSVFEWQQRLIHHGVIDGKDPNVRKRFWELKKALKSKKLVDELGGLVWLCPTKN